MTNSGALRSVKLAHTAIWAFFVSCILGIPFVAWWGHYRTAALLVAIVALEVTVLVFGRMRCPLTTLATRYTVSVASRPILPAADAMSSIG